MEKYYSVILILLVLVLLIAARFLSSWSRGKARQAGIARQERKAAEGRDSMNPRYIGITDVANLSLAPDQVRASLDALKYLTKQQDGTWGTRSAFSKQYPYRVNAWPAADGGTQVATVQYLTRNGVVDGESSWRVVVDHFVKEAKKANATFTYAPATFAYTSSDLEKNTTLHVASI